MKLRSFAPFSFEVALAAIASRAQHDDTTGIPWATGVHQSALIVAGATLEGGQQILFLLQRNQEGVTLDPPVIDCTIDLLASP